MLKVGIRDTRMVKAGSIEPRSHSWGRPCIWDLIGGNGYFWTRHTSPLYRPICFTCSQHLFNTTQVLLKDVQIPELHSQSSVLEEHRWVNLGSIFHDSLLMKYVEPWWPEEFLGFDIGHLLFV